MVHVAAHLDGPTGATLGDQLSVDLHLRADAIRVSITNLGEAPIDVLWGRASLVDTEGSVYGVVHSGATGSPDPEPLGTISRIAPKATLDDFVVPTRSVRFDPRYGWLVEPLLPVECGPIRCVGYHELVGKTVDRGSRRRWVLPLPRGARRAGVLGPHRSEIDHDREPPCRRDLFPEGRYRGRLFVGHPKLAFVSREVGEKEIKKCNLISK
jgi:hypothetical protein